MADFLGMMKQAAQLQSKMKAMQTELEQIEVEGLSGGGLVKVRITAKMETKAISIDPSLIKPDERDAYIDMCLDHWDEYGGEMMQIGAPESCACTLF